MSREHRQNPDSQEQASRENDREVRNLKLMAAMKPRGCFRCVECGEDADNIPEDSDCPKCGSDDLIQICPMCGSDIDDDTKVCPKCQEAVA